jgi:hypothetical protein
VTVHGKVRGAKGGRVSVTVQRRRGRHWATVRRFTAKVAASPSTYAKDVHGLPAGRYRVRARYLGAPGARPSQSRYYGFSVRS